MAKGGRCRILRTREKAAGSVTRCLTIRAPLSHKPKGRVKSNDLPGRIGNTLWSVRPVIPGPAPLSEGFLAGWQSPLGFCVVVWKKACS